ncbi:MAG: hypothetical protein GXP28_10555, partial [Planctomycetes bacterium]|nr:hypothetical protein [Planctomycetota bacterium]
MRKAFIGILGLCTLLIASLGIASPERKELQCDIDQLYNQVLKIVRHHFPDATSHKLNN